MRVRGRKGSSASESASARQSGSKAAVNGEKWMVDGSEREQERELAIPCLFIFFTCTLTSTLTAADE